MNIFLLQQIVHHTNGKYIFYDFSMHPCQKKTVTHVLAKKKRGKTVEKFKRNFYDRIRNGFLGAKLLLKVYCTKELRSYLINGV